MLELHTLFTDIRMKCRSTKFHNTRNIVGNDNQVTMFCTAKGRSPSYRLNRVLRRLAAAVLASNQYLAIPYLRSKDNPADQPSRFEEGSGSDPFVRLRRAPGE